MASAYEMQTRGSYQSVDTHEEDDEWDPQRRLPPDVFGSSSSFSSLSYPEQLRRYFYSLPQAWQARLSWMCGCLLASLLLILLFASSATHRRHYAPSPSPSSTSSSELAPQYQKPLPSPSTATLNAAFSPPTTSDTVYGGVTLLNRLEVLLVSNPTFPSCAAGLAVGSGSWMDPPALPGLSHFLEHAVFLGSEEYPDESGFASYLSAHAGQTNAYTAEQRTVYFLSVEPAGWDGALKRFAALLQHPLLRVDSLQREVRAVNSEHEKNRNDDVWRLYELLKAQSSPLHPFSRFGTGTTDTLHSGGAEVRAAMVALFERYYESGNMKLVLVGRDDLQQLQDQAAELFSSLPYNASYTPDPLPPAFPADTTGRVVYVQPVSVLHQLNVFFPLTPTALLYRDAPTAYVCWMLGQEGKGSLLQWLRTEGWGTAVEVGMVEDSPELSVLQVSMRLTEQGVFHYQQAVVRLFQQLQLIAERGVQRSFWDEQRKLKAMQYLYGTQPTAIELASTLAGRLLTVPMADVLLPPDRLRWDQAAVRSVLSELTVERCIVHVISNSFEDRVLTQREPIYGTRFQVFPLLPEFVKLVQRGLQQVALANVSELALPATNPFVFEPSPPSTAESKAPLSAPVLWRDGYAERVWMQRDISLRQPKLVLYLSFLLPQATRDTLPAFALLSLYVRLVQASFQTVSYPAALAGYDASVALSHSGLLLTLSGYSAGMDRYLQLLLPHLLQPQLSPALFQSIVREYAEDLHNTRAQLAYAQALYWLSWWLEADSWREEEVRELLPTITASNYTAAWRDDVFGHVLLESLAYGDVDDELMQRLLSTLHAAPAPLAFVVPAAGKSADGTASSSLLAARKLGERGQMLLPPAASSYVYRHVNLNAADTANAAVVVHVPLAAFGSRTEATLASLLSVLIRQAAFDVLRTQQQLGYIVKAACSAVSMSSLQWVGLTVTVQGVEQGAAAMDGEVERFLQSWGAAVGDWDERLWQERVDGWRRELQQRTERLEDAAAEQWNEVMSGRQWWRRRDEQTAPPLVNVSQANFVAWYKARVLPPERRRISMQVLSRRDSPDATGTFSLPSAATAESPIQLRDDSRDKQRQSWSQRSDFDT